LALAVLQTNIASLVLLPQMHHQPKGGGQWSHVAETAPELKIINTSCYLARTNMTQNLAVAIEVSLTHYARYVRLNVQSSVVGVQLLMSGGHKAAGEALVNSLIERLYVLAIFQTATTGSIHIIVFEVRKKAF